MPNEDLNDAQNERIAVLDCVLHNFRGSDYSPDSLDMIVLADWVWSGGINAALTGERMRYEQSKKSTNDA